MGTVVVLPNRIKIQATVENMERIRTTMQAAVIQYGHELLIKTRYIEFFVFIGAWLVMQQSDIMIMLNEDDDLSLDLS